MKKPDNGIIKKLIREALAEDRVRDDITSSLFSARTSITAKLIAREKGIIAGLDIARLVFRSVSGRIKFQSRLHDGASLRPGRVVANLRGPARPIFGAERAALNFLGRLSGIATLTGEFVRKANSHSIKILDTRKTTPLLRELEKYAVRIGGGRNHRLNLSGQVLIKDNHIKVMAKAKARAAAHAKQFSLAALVGLAKRKTPRGVKVEIEVESLRQFRDALRGKPDIIMLDNMTPAGVRRAVLLRNSAAGRRPLLEVSGGITLKNIRSFARTGVDLISVGALTHSASSLDFSLEVIRTHNSHL